MSKLRNFMLLLLAAMLLFASASPERAVAHHRLGAAPVISNVYGYDGTIAISGNTFVNGHGNQIKLRGMNLSGMEYGLILGYMSAWEGSNWYSGSVAPDWTYIATWNPNIIRIPLTPVSFLNLTWDQTVQNAITFTAAPAQNSTGGTLTAAFSGPAACSSPCQLPIQFDGDGGQNATVGTFTNGSTAVTWPPLYANDAVASVNYLTWGASPKSGDPYSNYRSTLISTINSIRAMNAYVILDMHTDQPTINIAGTSYVIAPTQQSNFITSNGLNFWTQMPQWLAATFGSPGFNAGTACGNTTVYNGGAAGANYNSAIGGCTGFGDIVFEAFNEPTANQMRYGVSNSSSPYWGGGGGTQVAPYTGMVQGGDYGFAVYDPSSNWFFYYPWQMGGYNQVISNIRATGATNVVLTNFGSYAQDITNYASVDPTDSLNQWGWGYHAYPNQSNWPYTTAGPFPGIGSGYTQTNVNTIFSALNTGHPILLTEDGDYGGPSYTTSNALAYIQTVADVTPIGYTAWSMSYMGTYNTNQNNQLAMQNSAGNNWQPIQGEGLVTYGWMQPHPNKTVQLDLPSVYSPPYYNSGTSHSFSTTLASADNYACLIWHVGNAPSAEDLSTAAINTTYAMTEVSGTYQNQGYEGVSLWCLANPPTGSITVSYTISAAAGEQMPTIIGLQNVNTSNPFGTVAGSSAHNQTMTLTGTAPSDGGTALCTMIMDASAITPNYSGPGGVAPILINTANGDSPTSKVTWDGLFGGGPTPEFALNGTGSSADGWAAFIVPINPSP